MIDCDCVFASSGHSGHCQAMADELLEVSGQALARESEIHQSTPIGFLIGCSAQMDSNGIMLGIWRCVKTVVSRLGE